MPVYCSFELPILLQLNVEQVAHMVDKVVRGRVDQRSLVNAAETLQLVGCLRIGGEVVTDCVNGDFQTANDRRDAVKAVASVLFAVREYKEHHLRVGDLLFLVYHHLQRDEYGVIGGGASLYIESLYRSREVRSVLVVKNIDWQIDVNVIGKGNQTDVIVGADI